VCLQQIKEKMGTPQTPACLSGVRVIVLCRKCAMGRIFLYPRDDHPATLIQLQNNSGVLSLNADLSDRADHSLYAEDVLWAENSYTLMHQHQAFTG
jgi:hypothetical protein